MIAEPNEIVPVGDRDGRDMLIIGDVSEMPITALNQADCDPGASP